MKNILFYLMAATLSIACSRNDGNNQTLQIKGSDTEVNMVQRMAEVYMQNNSEASIAVTGGGSGRGIAALINGETDIANASRPLKDSELNQLNDNGINPQKVVIAMDKIAIIINDQMKGIESLNLKDLAQIYTGEVTNWNEFGGPDLEISLYGRQSNSGTYTYFRNEVLKDDYSQTMKNMNGNAQIVESVKNDPGAIGYVGIGYVVDEEDNVSEGLKVMKIAPDASSQAIKPTRKNNGKNENYALARPLYQFFDENPTQRIIDFVVFELSEKGQQIVSTEGYYPVNQKYHNQNVATLNFIDEESNESS